MTKDFSEQSKRSQDIRAFLCECVRKRRVLLLQKYAGKTDVSSKSKCKDIMETYELDTILRKGAAVAAQAQIATHISKGIHPVPEVKNTTNLHITPTQFANHGEVGTHSLQPDHMLIDATGNGAINKSAYIAYWLLKHQFEEKSILQLLENEDEEAINALHQDPENARKLANSLVFLEQQKCPRFASHTLMKQVYWLLGFDAMDDTKYHLLAPLYAASLAHAVHQEINDARFGEANKQARHAKDDDKYFDGTYREYSHLAERKLGGSKPQNISQLNSERGGVNYLLNSLPPQWQSQTKKFLNIESAFKHFRYDENVPDLLNALCQLLKDNPKPTMETRRQREAIEQALGQALAAFGLSVQYARQPGWTRAAECQLPLCEQIWLDPERADLPVREGCEEEDIAFAQAFEWKDWPDEVATRFGLWLNDILRQQIENFPVGDVEARHWARQAIIDTVDRPATVQRHAMPNTMQQEATHG